MGATSGGMMQGPEFRYDMNNVNKLIFYDVFGRPEEAISAEKKIKGWTRQKKLNLIKSKNLYFEELCI